MDIVVRSIMSVLSVVGDMLNGVVASAVLGKWLLCHQFRCSRPRGGLKDVGVRSDMAVGKEDLGELGDAEGGWRGRLRRRDDGRKLRR